MDCDGKRSATPLSPAAVKALSLLRFASALQNKITPRIGETGELAVSTDMKHAVEFVGDGMPAVVSTSNLVGFLECPACQTLLPQLDADECSVGIEIDLRHLAPTPVGQMIHCTARVIAAEGRKVTFQIEARDQHEAIVRGLHKRAVIHAESFTKRVKAKGG